MLDNRFLTLDLMFSKTDVSFCFASLVKRAVCIRAEKLLGRKISKSNLPGSPDFVYPMKRIAVFLHGCFWHRCPECNFDLLKSNHEYWVRKFARNTERDELVKEELEALGWRVIIIWEHELDEDFRMPTFLRLRRRILTKSD